VYVFAVLEIANGRVRTMALAVASASMKLLFPAFAVAVVIVSTPLSAPHDSL